MKTIVLRGRCVVPGAAAGTALVSREAISGWGGMDFSTGVITERRHPLYGQSFAGKVLVFVGAKGSSGWSHYFNLARHSGVAPKAMIFNRMSTKVALGAVVSRVPSVTDLDQDPLEVIETGDRVEVEATTGLVTVTKTQSVNGHRNGTPDLHGIGTPPLDSQTGSARPGGAGRARLK